MVSIYKDEIDKLGLNPKAPPHDDSKHALPEQKNHDAQTVIRVQAKRLGELEKEIARLKKSSQSAQISTALPDDDGQINIGDVVEFFYTNAKGESDFREVRVTYIDDEYLEGVDLNKHAERTFRLDRISGGITDTKTGEIIWI